MTGPSDDRFYRDRDDRFHRDRDDLAALAELTHLTLMVRCTTYPRPEPSRTLVYRVNPWGQIIGSSVLEWGPSMTAGGHDERVVWEAG